MLARIVKMTITIIINYSDIDNHSSSNIIIVIMMITVVLAVRVTSIMINIK